jgi:DNA-directed RNA polymerase specialized sigma24 family protein
MTGTNTQVFPSTHWSIVLAATDGDSERARGSLEKLCRTYWYPIYALVRHRGYSSHDSEDLVQGFFTHVLEKEVLNHVNRDKGRFRSFLLACLCNYLNHEWHRTQTQRRGGGCDHLSLDTLDAESRYAEQTSAALTPEQLFDRAWALGVLQQALEKLRGEFQAGGRGELFDALEGHLTGTQPCPGYGELAARCGMNEAALRMMVTRLRRRYGELVRLEISHTLKSADDVEPELADLLAVLGGKQ